MHFGMQETNNLVKENTTPCAVVSMNRRGRTGPVGGMDKHRLNLLILDDYSDASHSFVLRIVIAYESAIDVENISALSLNRRD
jgi:hypothetical protein